MRKESEIEDFYYTITHLMAFPCSSNWILPDSDSIIKFHEVSGALKVLKWVLKK